MPRVLGVDVSLGRGLDVVLLVDATVKEIWSRLGATDLRRLLEELDPDAVAIDAPPKPGLGLLRDPAEAAALPVPPPPGSHLARRIAEYELSRRGIGSHQTHFEEAKLFSWMTAGFEAFHAAGQAGYAPFFGEGSPRHRALEAFPYASYVALAGCLSPGRRWRLPWRRSVLGAAEVSGLPVDAGIDLVDAACAAFTGVRFLDGRGSFLGDPREGAIVLPVPSLLDRYRRCPILDAGANDVFSIIAPPLCQCGCGLPVSRRFRPGHDAKRKAALWQQALQGNRAVRELKERGWKLPPEMP